MGDSECAGARVGASGRLPLATWSWESGLPHRVYENLAELEGEHKDPNADEVVVRPSQPELEGNRIRTKCNKTSPSAAGF